MLFFKTQETSDLSLIRTKVIPPSQKTFPEKNILNKAIFEITYSERKRLSLLSKQNILITISYF